MSSMKKSLLSSALAALVVAPGAQAFASELVCESLDMVWYDANGNVIRADPYVCGADLCGGYRCKEGYEISPACYNAAECPLACAGECVYIPTAQLDCGTMCAPAGCNVLMTWYKRKTLLRSEPYDGDGDLCGGYRCLVGDEISPACYSASECAKSCRQGTCVDIQALQAEASCSVALCGY